MHRSLIRPNLLMGGERRPVLMLLVATIGLAVASMNVVAVCVSVFIYVSVIFYLRLMAKSDPYMVGIYLRSLKFKPYYAPRSRPSCRL